MIPTREECLGLLERYRVRQPKIVHSLLVEKTAVAIARLLNEKGYPIDEILVSRGALLHDIGKDLTKKGHGVVGAQVCSREGVDQKIQDIIRKHEVESIIHEKLNDEEKIVYYADKVCKQELVGVEKRFAPWIERTHDKERFDFNLIRDSKAKTLELEKEILNKLGLSPDELFEILRG